MTKKILSIITVFICFTSVAQLKKITLEDGVLQQNRKFGADKLTGFQWIPTTSNYVYYTDAWTKMVTASTKDASTKELVTLSDINTALGTKIKNFFGTQWIDSNTILVSDNGKYYTYSVATKSGKLHQETTETFENTTFDASKNNLAFTEENNLYILNKNKEKIAITSNSDKKIGRAHV